MFPFNVRITTSSFHRNAAINHFHYCRSPSSCLCLFWNYWSLTHVAYVDCGQHKPYSLKKYIIFYFCRHLHLTNIIQVLCLKSLFAHWLLPTLCTLRSEQISRTATFSFLKNGGTVGCGLYSRQTVHAMFTTFRAALWDTFSALWWVSCDIGYS